MTRLAAITCCLALASSPGCREHDPDVQPVMSGDCELCHEADYTAAASPPHVGILPASECVSCHSTTMWSPAIFEHGRVRNRECRLCHQPDYDSTSDPVHAGMFPTICDQCHQTTAWRPALIGLHPEASFPIDSGPHKEFTCLECHNLDLGPSTDGMNTDCIGCHTGDHRQSEMDDKHDEVRDYLFDPQMPNFCLRCHPNGRH